MPEYSKVMIRRSRLPRRMRSVPQVLGRRMAEFDRRDPRLDKAWCGVPTPDVQIDRRKIDVRAYYCAEVTKTNPLGIAFHRRRKGDERRDTQIHRLYKQSPDPRIRALERRKV